MYISWKMCSLNVKKIVYIFLKNVPIESIELKYIVNCVHWIYRIVYIL